MNNFKICLSVLISISMLSLCSCGTKTAEPEVSENVVEINLDDYSKSTVSSLTDEADESLDLNTTESTHEENGSISEENSDKESDTADQEDSKNNENDEVKPKSKRKTITGTPVDDSWFDDCVFIGDSLTLGLSLYNDWMDIFGDAQFVCSAGLNWNNAQWDINDENGVHPVYKGEKILVEDAINITGANKAIIGFGMNDIAIFGVDRALEAADELLTKIQDKSPGVPIYLITVSPMIESAEYDKLNNTLIREYDDRLPEVANKHGCDIINSWDALVDENGNLPDELCEDPNALGIHLNNDGCAILSECIKNSVE